MSDHVPVGIVGGIVLADGVVERHSPVASREQGHDGRKPLLDARSRVAEPPPVCMQAAARMVWFSSIEGWCNPARRHSGLGYRSPMASKAMRQAGMNPA